MFLGALYFTQCILSRCVFFIDVNCLQFKMQSLALGREVAKGANLWLCLEGI